jgi:hypothetical protein
MARIIFTTLEIQTLQFYEQKNAPALRLGRFYFNAFFAHTASEKQFLLTSNLT